MMNRKNLPVLGALFFIIAVSIDVPAAPTGCKNTRQTACICARRCVTDFGAVGDGRTDDTAAIQRAVDAGGVVYFPAGKYRLTQTIVVDLAAHGKTSLAGDGTACVIMAGPGPAFHLLGSHGGSGDPTSVRDQIWDKERLPLITGMEIRGEHSESIGLRLEKTMKAIVTNVLIRRCKIGIHIVKRNRNLIIAQCHIYHNTQIGIDFDQVNLHQANITGNHISYNPVAGIRLKAGNMRNFQIVGNDIEYNHDEKKQGSADILIDLNIKGSSFLEGTIVGNTIQARPSPGGANILFLGGPTPRIGGLLTITGNLISSQTDNIALVNCHGITIVGNSLFSAAANNIRLQNCDNIVLSNNSIDHDPDYKKKHLVDGILIEGCRGITVSDTIIQNSLKGSPQAGGAIEVNASRDVSITNCQVLDPQYRGITLTDVVRCRVAGCSVLDRRQKPSMISSIELTGNSRDNLITDNIVNAGSLSIAPGTATTRDNLQVQATD